MPELSFLTNDAKYLLTALYKEYLSRRNAKIPKNRAVKFNDVPSIQENFMPQWIVEDVDFTCRELVRHNLLNGSRMSNQYHSLELTTEAIALLETTFKDQVDNVLTFMQKIKNAIPFL